MARFVRSPDVIARRIAGETVLVPIAVRTESAARRTANFYVLNETGEFLWKHLDIPVGVDELARHLVHQFEVSAADARADVEQFISELTECGAIQNVESS